MPTPARVRTACALHDVFTDANRVREGWNAGLSPEDAGLALAMLGICLRRWGRLNAWCRPRLDNPSRGLPAGTRIALCMGLAQLAWLPGVAAHAAVDESVGLASDANIGFPPHRGLVNAILRSAAKDRGRLALELDSLPPSLDRSPFADELLQAALQDRYTPDNAYALWQRLQRPPRPSFVVLGGEPPSGLVPDPRFPRGWCLVQDASGGRSAAPDASGVRSAAPDASGVRSAAPDVPFPAAWLRSGAGMVQDVSSQALMAFDWPPEKNNPTRILDLCAAPGGKTTLLSRRWPDAEITALEQSPRRANRLRENLAARGARAKVAVADAAEWLPTCGRAFDLILIDAPCSASGTIQKHPELNWIYRRQDAASMARIQEGLLDAAVPRLAPGGLLVYSACSWFPEEGLGHLPRLESKHPQLAPAPIWQNSPCGAGHLFRPDPLAWEGEGFQAFALAAADELISHP
jgi:16S rRNA (cytosine967-C5)-methyltransferase